MLTINSWYHCLTNNQFKEIHKPKDGKEYTIASSIRSLTLPRSCFRVFGAFYGSVNEPEYYGGFELLFRDDQFSDFVKLLTLAESLSNLYPGCEFFLQNCTLMTGKYTNRHQLIVLFPMDNWDEIGKVARAIVDFTRRTFPDWDGRKGEAVERISYNPWGVPEKKGDVDVSNIRIKRSDGVSGWGIEYNYSDDLYQMAFPANRFISACQNVLDTSLWTHKYKTFSDTGYQCFEYHGDNPETVVPAAARNISAIIGCKIDLPY